MDGELIRGRIGYEIVAFEGADYLRISVPNGAVYFLPVGKAEREVGELVALFAAYRADRGRVLAINPEK